MKIEGEKIDWGMDVDEGEKDEVEKLLGVDNELHTPGENANITANRKEAVELIQDPQREIRNARQTTLMYKQGHGRGANLESPQLQQTCEAMEGYQESHMVPIYGDGSFTTPIKWWAALGGHGVWIPDWNRNAETLEARMETNLAGTEMGQTQEVPPGTN